MAVDIGKAKKVLDQAFLDNVSEISEDEASALIVRSAQKMRDLKFEMDNDEDLLAATQVLKDMKGGYTSVLKYEAAKVQHLLEKIDEIQEGDVNPEASV